MSDTGSPTTKTKRLRTVSLVKIEDGVAHFNIFSRELDANGKQTVAAVQQVLFEDIHPDLRAPLALVGFNSVWANRYNRLDDPSPEAVLESLKPLYEAIHDGSWSPGRVFDERDPTDAELAIAEFTGRSVSDIMDAFENTYEKNADGTDKTDKRGHRSKVWTAKVIAEAVNDPRVKPIYARLVAERAKRLSAEAKKGGTENSLLSGLFAQAPPVADAAN